MTRRNLPVAVALWLAALIAPGLASEMAGYIVDYSGSAEGISVERSGAPVPISIGALVQAGDVVKAYGADRVIIDLGGGVTEIGSETGSFIVPRPGPLAPFLAKMRELAEIVKWHSKAADVSARTREGYKLSVPMLEGPKIKLVAGRRTLRLGLLDGTPPFRWTVVNNGKPAGTAASAQDRWLEMSVTLAPGAATLLVEDAAGRPLSFHAEVAAAAAEPSLTDTPLGRIAAAAELSRRERGAYAFEAAQLVAGPDATRAERALRDAFLIGDRP